MLWLGFPLISSNWAWQFFKEWCSKSISAENEVCLFVLVYKWKCNSMAADILPLELWEMVMSSVRWVRSCLSFIHKTFICWLQYDRSFAKSILNVVLLTLITHAHPHLHLSKRSVFKHWCHHIFSISCEVSVTRTVTDSGDSCFTSLLPPCATHPHPQMRTHRS